MTEGLNVKFLLQNDIGKHFKARRAKCFWQVENSHLQNRCKELTLFPSPYLLLRHRVGFSSVSQWKLPYAEPYKLLAHSPFVMGFCKTYKKSQTEREHAINHHQNLWATLDCGKVSCSLPGSVLSARGTENCYCPVIRALLEAGSAGGTAQTYNSHWTSTGKMPLPTSINCRDVSNLPALQPR